MADWQIKSRLHVAYGDPGTKELTDDQVRVSPSRSESVRVIRAPAPPSPARACSHSYRHHGTLQAMARTKDVVTALLGPARPACQSRPCSALVLQLYMVSGFFFKTLNPKP
jgi:hypothetical protein